MKNVLDEGTRKMFLFEMAKQREMYWGIKAIFPHMNKSIIGQSSVDTANYYKARGYFFKLVFLRPLTESDIERNNEISRWMNENYVVRLYALLNSYKIVSCLSSVDELLSFVIVMELIFGVISWGRGGFSLPILGRLKSPLPMKER